MKAQRSYQLAMRNSQDEKVRIQKELDEIELNRRNFEQESEKVRGLVGNEHLIRFNVRGRTIVTRRKTLLKVPGSLLAKTFDGTHQNDLHRNPDGSYFLDYNPVIFTRLLDQLRTLKPNKTIYFSPPLSSTLIKPFNRMLEEFGLPLPKQSPNDIISLNVGGERIVTLRKTLTSVPNSELARLISSSNETKYDHLGQPFLDYNPKLFQHLLDQLRQGKNLTAPSNEDKNAYESMLTGLGLKNNISSTIATTTTTITTTNAKQTKFSATTKPTISASKNKLRKQQLEKQKTTSMKPLTSTSKTPANKKSNSKNTDEYQRTTTKVEKISPGKTEATILTATVINTSSIKDKTSTINGALQTTTDETSATIDPTSQVITARTIETSSGLNTPESDSNTRNISYKNKNSINIKFSPGEIETTTMTSHESSTSTDSHINEAANISQTAEDDTTPKSDDGNKDTFIDTTSIDTESSSIPETITETYVSSPLENDNDINTPTESALDAAA
ncbi:unnamed protein product [Adineta steineri]|uniref:Potassium channel tetramerisation-type BTB domain-containing protein n=1 Tax=Adineta steineri TaxID=433720 RepID=A0A815GL99_9BILA|nr:unnamed protein product [Adineta steineri]CAF1339871.1 unnamed protein product [Adineta steineri]